MRPSHRTCRCPMMKTLGGVVQLLLYALLLILPACVRAAPAGPGSPPFLAAAAQSSSPPERAPLFTLARPDLVIRPPEPLVGVASGVDVRRYVIAVRSDITSPSSSSNGSPATRSSPPRLRSADDALNFVRGPLPSFMPAQLTHVFSLPSVDAPRVSSANSGSPSPSPFSGFSAYLTPDQVAALRNNSAQVDWIEEDSRVQLAVMPGAREVSMTASVGLTVETSSGAKQAAERQIRAAAESTSEFATRSWALDRADQRSLPLDGNFQPDFNWTKGDSSSDSSSSSSSSSAAANPSADPDGMVRYGSGALVYLIDTGCKTDHREFAPTGRAQLVYSRFKDGVNDDPNGHGTHTASLAGGNNVGVARRALIKCLRVLDAEGTGSYSDILQAMSWIRTREAERRQQAASDGVIPSAAIVSQSFGGAFSAALNSMAVSLVDAGIHAVVAMGNLGQSACSDNAQGFSPAAAAASTAIIAVGSSGTTDGFSTFSNYGPCMTLSAPGEDIMGAWPKAGEDATYALLSGTSMATPIVAGVVALYLGQYPQTTPADMKAILACSATRSAVIRLPSTATTGDLLYANLRRCAGMSLSEPIPIPTTDNSGTTDSSGSGQTGAPTQPPSSIPTNNNNNNNNNSNSGNSNNSGSGGGSDNSPRGPPGPWLPIPGRPAAASDSAGGPGPGPPGPPGPR